MIRIKDGDLLDAFYRVEVDCIAHVVNCQGVMGAGIAKQIKERYAVVERHYKLACATTGHASPLGTAQRVMLTDHKMVINLFAQKNYGVEKRQLHYGALASSLFEMRYDLLETWGVGHGPRPTIGLPYGLGCGLAGGDWTVVSELIETALSDFDVTIYKFDR